MQKHALASLPTASRLEGRKKVEIALLFLHWRKRKGAVFSVAKLITKRAGRTVPDVLQRAPLTRETSGETALTRRSGALSYPCCYR